MGNFIKKIRAALHTHNYDTPILSMYWTFNTRRIIYQCKCGGRKEYFVTIPYGSPLPIQTSMNIDSKKFEAVLNANNFTRANN